MISKKFEGLAPLRRETVSAEDNIPHKYTSLVQAYFMELTRFDGETKDEKPKEKNLRMSRFLSKLVVQFMVDHEDQVRTKNSFEDAIEDRKRIERLLVNDSIFIEKNGGGHENVDLREDVFEIVFNTLDHAWRAKHSGLYARDLPTLAKRVEYIDLFWNSEPGKIKLREMGLDADAIVRDRTKLPLLFGPAEQLNPLPAMLTLGYRDLVDAIDEANGVLSKVIGNYIELTPLVAKRMLLCLPTLAFDQVSKSNSASSSLHIHLNEGEVFGLVSDSHLAKFNRMPIKGLTMRVKPSEIKNKKTGESEFRKGEVTLLGAVEKLREYVLGKINSEDVLSEFSREKIQKFLTILESLYAEYQNSEEVNYVEFATKMNSMYVSAFFPNIKMPIEFIDEQIDGRLGNLFKYVTDMNKLISFMVEHRFFDTENELVVRVSQKNNDGTFTKFARYRWNKALNSGLGSFEVNAEDKMDYGSEIATNEGGRYKQISLEEIRDEGKFVAIGLKDLEYVMLGFGIMPEMIVLDDGVFYYAYKYLSDASQRVTGSKPLYYAYNPVDPTKFDYK